MTENFLKAMFFLILFATLLLQLIFSDNQSWRPDRNENSYAPGSELVGTLQKKAEESRDTKVLPARIRRTSR
jgi:hypothetical protein